MDNLKTESLSEKVSGTLHPGGQTHAGCTGSKVPDTNANL